MVRMLTFLLLFAISGGALAFDCTPIETRTCGAPDLVTTTDQGAVPGDVTCGSDYTGWDMKVYEVVVAEAGYVGFQALVQAPGGQVAVLVYDDCAGGSCIASQQAPNLAEVLVCLEAGTYTMVVATNFAAPQPLLVGNPCVTCTEIIQAGAEDLCPLCAPVDGEVHGWGSWKARFE